ncbi:hypothetical protein [Acaryochloris sp. IP29b_bin.137]|uniref:hypothetical protein n=1 Tax=Acaryochloris sp. IP29b_bin.137 TaxID=2969217 RepID=UPI0026126CA0|nr:hypothetical protein [Acaryochloris sp. IP29b_bin.137]
MGNVQSSLVSRGIETLGDWNPQLMREIQGRLKVRSVFLTVLSSLIAQGLFLFWRYRTIEMRWGNCATAEYQKTGKACLQVGPAQYVLVNWPAWWLQVFAWSCILLMFGLIVGGMFMLISDLSREDRQGTLTFISLSPQTARTLLLGKMLGVPFLVYLAVFLALPLHYAAGLAAQIPALKIASFDLLLLASCFFFYSLALLLGLVGNWLNGFQSWLGSAGILMLLLLFKNTFLSRTAIDWLFAFTPSVILPYVTQTFEFRSYGERLPFDHNNILEWQWFTIPIGSSGWMVLLFGLAHFGLWAWWLWRPLQRRFRNPTVSLLSKPQSYWATACFFTSFLGFAVLSQPADPTSTIAAVLVPHLLWFLLMIVLLLPHHQDLEDWARFRGHYPSAKGRMQRVKDLLRADNSPTWVAISINLGIAGIPIMVWILSLPEDEHMAGVGGLLLSSTLIWVYALFNQVILLRPLSHRNWWVIATLLGPILLPTLLFILMGIAPGQWGGRLFLLTPFAFAILKDLSAAVALQMFGVHLAMIAGLTWSLNRQLQRFGESTTQRLFQRERQIEQS